MPPEAHIHKSVVVPGTAQDTRKVCEQILSLIRDYKYSEDDIFAIHLALEEALINAVKHGNNMNPDKEVKVEYTIMPDKIDVSVTDQGRGFNSERVPDPRLDENLYKTNGRGLFLIRSYMDRIEFNEAGNCIRMIRHKGSRSGYN